ncbi:MAG: nucleotide exchange factor GrpE [Acidobacteria bacterium]|nr:nucleotide exchange factor GrpE [Acidobacteriota bacterium]
MTDPMTTAAGELDSPANSVPAGEPEDLVADPAETAATEPVSSPLETLLAEGLEAIRAELATKLTYDRFKEQQIERLHGELQEYKSDLLRRATEPLLHGLIKLHDHLGQLLSGLECQEPEELSPQRLLRYLDEFRDDVEMLLGRHGVEPFSVPTEAFDPRRQTAVDRLPSPDPSMNGHVAARIRPGFEIGDVVLQKERVAVLVAVPTAEPQPSTSPTSNSHENTQEDLSP